MKWTIGNHHVFYNRRQHIIYVTLFVKADGFKLVYQLFAYDGLLHNTISAWKKQGSIPTSQYHFVFPQ
jgi:hypothetical protein